MINLSDAQLVRETIIAILIVIPLVPAMMWSGKKLVRWIFN